MSIQARLVAKELIVALPILRKLCALLPRPARPGAATTPPSPGGKAAAAGAAAAAAAATPSLCAVHAQWIKEACQQSEVTL